MNKIKTIGNIIALILVTCFITMTWLFGIVALATLDIDFNIWGKIFVLLSLFGMFIVDYKIAITWFYKKNKDGK